MKTAVVQLNPKTARIEYNYFKIRSFIESETAADLIIFPAYALTGINAGDYFSEKSFIEEQNTFLRKLLPLSSEKDIVTGIIETSSEGNYVSVILLSQGTMKVLCRKKNLTDYEKKYFISGSGPADIEYKGRLLTLTLDTVDNCKTDFLLNMSIEYYRADNIEKRMKAKQYSEIRLNPVCLSSCYIYDGRSYFANKSGEKILTAPAYEETVLTYDDTISLPPLPTEEINEYDETIGALTFGLRDFCQKNNFKKVVLGLSGGIDSALSAVIAARAIGSENVTGITMPSEYSSEGSVTDSFALAGNLGIKCEEVPVIPVFDCFISNIQKKKYNDLAEENLQSRIRAIILMSYSNRENALLLATGNKSEVATGYCTLYGDTCGGLNILSDIYKTDIYKIAERINREKEIIPMSTMTKPPSAELRPDQKDTDTLPPYEILDKIIRLYFEERINPEEITYLCPDAPVYRTIAKILKAEFKRKQMTSGFKISKRSFVCDIDYPIV